MPHRRFSLAESGADYVAFSGHKTYAPFGAGALVGRRDWLDAAPAYLAGGGAVREVTVEETDAGPRRRTGTRAARRTCSARSRWPRPARRWPRCPPARWRRTSGRCASGWSTGLRRAARRPGAADLGRTPTEPTGVVSLHRRRRRPRAWSPPYLSAEHGIGVRDGRFCAHPLLARLGVPEGALRASVGVGSTPADVDRLLAGAGRVPGAGPAVRATPSVDGRWQPVDDPAAARRAGGRRSPRRHPGRRLRPRRRSDDAQVGRSAVGPLVTAAFGDRLGDRHAGDGGRLT